MRTQKTKRLTVTAVLLALATALALIAALIPFLHLPMGGGFTVASMLPIVIISYMYGVRWGLFASFTYSVIQIAMDLCLGVNGSVVMAMFMPESDGYMGTVAAVSIVVIDYFVAYTLLGLGGLFRGRKNKTAALVLGVLVALSLRYAAHVVSGYIFYGAWAEWFFSQEGWLHGIGAWLMARVNGRTLALIYSLLYNGLYMIPEIVLTALVAIPVSALHPIKKVDR